jgi:hypothetical protein
MTTPKAPTIEQAKEAVDFLLHNYPCDEVDTILTYFMQSREAELKRLEKKAFWSAFETAVMIPDSKNIQQAWQDYKQRKEQA